MRKEIASTIVIAIIAISQLYVIYSGAAVELTSQVITAAIWTADGIIIALFLWGWGDRIKKRLFSEENPSISATYADEKKELGLLIKPSYLIYKNFHDKRSGPVYKNLSFTPFLMSQGMLQDLKEARDLINLFEEQGDLAQPELKSRIKRFFEFREKQRNAGVPWNDPYFVETFAIVGEIETLVKTRYDELMWGKDES